MRTVAVGMALVVAATVLWSGCGGSDHAQPVEAVAADTLWTEIFGASPPVLIDVRTTDEYDLARLPHSDNDPNCGCNSWQLPMAAGPRNVVVIGGTEDHARRAADAVTLPTDRVRVLAGGFYAWQLGLDISAKQLHDWLLGTRRLRLVDVRPPAAWAARHLPNTENLPLADIDVWSQSLDKSEEVVCICAVGVSSANARDYLARHGFTKVHNLLGGTNNWPYETETTLAGRFQQEASRERSR